MNDLLRDIECRQRLPKFAVSRVMFRPDKTLCEVPLGVWRAANRDEAIKLAAHAFRRLALLKATRIQ